MYVSEDLILLLPLLNSSVLLLILISALKNITPPSPHHAITSSGQFLPLLTVDTTSALERSFVFSPGLLPHSTVHPTPWSIPCKMYEANLLNLFLTPSLIGWTGCLKQLHWLPIYISIKIALMAYRTLATSNPPYLHHLILRRHASGLRSSSTIQLRQPVHKSSLVNRGFSCPPAVWNALPPLVRAQSSLELFKVTWRPTSDTDKDTWRLWCYANGVFRKLTIIIIWRYYYMATASTDFKILPTC